MKKLCILSAVLLMLATVPAAFGQTITSRVTGTVADETGGVIAGATAELTNLISQQVRTTTTGANGRFLFSNVLAGTYDLHIEVPGFNSYDERGISVATQETVALGTLSLAVGEVTTSIEVMAQAARVQTESSDRSETINENTIESLPLIGRDYRGILNTLPGNAQTGMRDAPGWGGGGTPTINGGEIGTFLVTLDGIASQDSGAPNTQYINPSVDAIGEVKVMVTNYNAEYGSRSAGTMNVTMKAGTAAFHGTLYHYWRHESLNANSFFNNKEGDQRERYRYQNPGGTIGGPVIIPGTGFNESRTRMFFFYSEEHLRFKSPGGTTRIRFPQAAEYAGDFSGPKAVTEDGIPLSTIITDPTTGELFPGGVIPSNRTTPIGRAIMDLFPRPQAGVVDPSGQDMYNWTAQFGEKRKRIDRILRVDFNFGSSTTSYIRLIRSFESRITRRSGFLYHTAPFGPFESYYQIPTRGLSWTVVHTLAPTLINETTFGINRAHQTVGPTDQAEYEKAALLSAFIDPATGQPVTVPSIFPGSNDLNLVPEINFGSSGAQISGESLWGDTIPSYGLTNRWPFSGTDQITSINNNLSWIKGDHNLKFGFFAERMARNVSVYATNRPQGVFNFGTDEASPLDTGWPLSNALIGTVQHYGEDDRRLVNPNRYTQIEWFVQDSWTVTPRLSLDLGMRFSMMQPNWAKGTTLGVFSPGAYDASAVGQLLFPACSDGSTTGCDRDLQVAVNPTTGAVYPRPRQVLFDPASFSGSPFSGTILYDEHFFNTPGPVVFSPRFGFAYDVFGNGSTAVRGGFGIFYDRSISVDRIGDMMKTPPLFQSPDFYNTTFTEMVTAQPWFAPPRRIESGDRDFLAPTVYSWSFGIQQNIGWGTILDIAYVGNRGLHRFTNGITNLNRLPPGLTWTPEGMSWDAVNGPEGVGTPNQELLDPTNNNAFLNDRLIRSLVGYAGWNDIRYWNNRGGNSNYHSLQLQVNRRFGQGLTWSANYTWQRTHEYSPQQYVTNDALTYAHNGRKHVANMNFNWAVPDTRGVIDNAILTKITEGWNFSGIFAIFGGNPYGASCSVQSAPLGYPNGTVGGGIPFRCDQVGDALLPEGTPPPAGSGIDPRLYVPINEDAFVLPQPDSLGFGNSPLRNLGYGNGYFNMDAAIEKTISLKEDVSLVFRMDTFNFLNHFNPGNPETRIRYRYNANGPESQTRSSIGEISGDQSDPRTMALSLRLRF